MAEGDLLEQVAVFSAHHWSLECPRTGMSHPLQQDAGLGRAPDWRHAIAKRRLTKENPIFLALGDVCVPATDRRGLGTAQGTPRAMPTARGRRRSCGPLPPMTATTPMPLLPRNAARLLVVMFSDRDECSRSLADLIGEGFGRDILPKLLRSLVGAPARPCLRVVDDAGAARALPRTHHCLR
jgi:hypothetical protein